MEFFKYCGIFSLYIFFIYVYASHIWTFILGQDYGRLNWKAQVKISNILEIVFAPINFDPKWGTKIFLIIFYIHYLFIYCYTDNTDSETETEKTRKNGFRWKGRSSGEGVMGTHEAKHSSSQSPFLHIVSSFFIFR